MSSKMTADTTADMIIVEALSKMNSGISDTPLYFGRLGSRAEKHIAHQCKNQQSKYKTCYIHGACKDTAYLEYRE